MSGEMIEDTVKIVNEAIKDKTQVNLIINNRAGGNAPLIAQKIASIPLQGTQKDGKLGLNFGLSSGQISLTSNPSSQYTLPVKLRKEADENGFDL